MMPDKNLLGYANRLNGWTLHWARLAYFEVYPQKAYKVTKEDLLFASRQQLLIPLRRYSSIYSKYEKVAGFCEHIKAIKDLISFMES